MRRVMSLLVVMVVVNLASAWAAAALAGNWVGQIESAHGSMQIRLSVVEEKGTLTGKLATGHGDWEVTSIAEKDGTWTVSFTHDMGSGHLSGRIEGDRFKGTWDNGPNRTGPFNLTRAKK